MNQAFGGAFLIKIALIFLSIYIVVLGFAMNYAKVFTMKNKIITLIEQYEGYSDTDSSGTDIVDEIAAKANELQYKGITDGSAASYISDKGWDCVNTRNLNLYCIVETTADNYTYYKVITFIQFNIPVVTSIAKGIIPITGETRYIYNFDN